jgi:WD40 repeat protein
VHVQDDGLRALIPAPAGGITNVHWGSLIGDNFVRLFDTLAGPRRLEVWSVSSVTLRYALDDVAPRARHAISPDGKWLAIGRTDQAIHIHELATGQQVRRIPLEESPGYLTFDTTGDRLVLYHGAWAAACVLDIATGSRASVFEARDITWAAAWQPRGDLLAGASGTAIELWDTVRRRRSGLLSGHDAQVVHLQFSADGGLLLSGSWDGESCTGHAG